MSALVSYVVYDRDEHGVPFAIEIVDAPSWDPAVLSPPAPEEADARVVRLWRGRPPAHLPPWLAVEPTAALRNAGVREDRGSYGGDGGHAGDPAEAADGDGTPSSPPNPNVGDVGRRLWPWSPHFREPGASLDEFLAAGTAALRHPRPAPTERDRRLEALTSFCAGQAEPLGSIARLQDEALERWFAQAFRDPDTLADAVLLARIEEADPATAAELRFLRDAEVPADAQAHLEMALDRRVLLAQASPWRYVEGATFGTALAATRAWRRRYEAAYGAHYRAALLRMDEAATALDRARGAASAVRRLDGIERLGPPLGAEALAIFDAADREIAAMPRDPVPGAARTAGVVLGRDPIAFVRATAAAQAVREALELHRRRLASATVRLVLGRPEVPTLDRLLQAIVASDLDGIERVLDDALAGHIDRLLQDAARSPLQALVEEYPQVSAGTLDAAIERLRALLTAAVEDAPEGRVELR